MQLVASSFVKPAFGFLSPAAQQAIAQAKFKMAPTNEPPTWRQLGNEFFESLVSGLPYTVSGVLLGSVVKGLIKSKRDLWPLMGAFIGQLISDDIRMREKQRLDAFLHKKRV